MPGTRAGGTSVPTLTPKKSAVPGARMWMKGSGRLVLALVVTLIVSWVALAGTSTENRLVERPARMRKRKLLTSEPVKLVG